jgi:hypothetical protein
MHPTCEVCATASGVSRDREATEDKRFVITRNV